MKKIIALLLIFSPVLLSGNLIAKEWKHSFSLKTQKVNEWKYGFTLSTQKTTEQLIMKKFTPEKKNSIILLEPKFEMDVSFLHLNNINIGEIIGSKFWKGFLYGGLIGGATGAFVGLISGDDEGGWFAMTAGDKALIGAALGIVIGGVIGGIIAVVT